MQNERLYQKYRKGEHWNEHSTNYAERFCSFLKKHQFAGLIIDAGCGSGRDVNVFTAHDFNALGIDISKKVITHAKNNFPECRFEMQDIQNLGFKDSSISAFYIINVIHYIDKKRTIKEILRTLLPGGYVLIHFNLSITDDKGNEDLKDDENTIRSLISDFKILEQRYLERTDLTPIKHQHKIMELVLQKPGK